MYFYTSDKNSAFYFCTTAWCKQILCSIWVKIQCTIIYSMRFTAFYRTVLQDIVQTIIVPLLSTFPVQPQLDLAYYDLQQVKIYLIRFNHIGLGSETIWASVFVKQLSLNINVGYWLKFIWRTHLIELHIMLLFWNPHTWSLCSDIFPGRYFQSLMYGMVQEKAGSFHTSWYTLSQPKNFSCSGLG